MIDSDPARPSAGRLADVARHLLEQVPDASPFLDGWPDLRVGRHASPCLLPVVRWLAHLGGFAVPETLGLVQAVQATAASLQWRQTYTEDDFGGAFLDRYGWSELIGLRGPIPSTRIACGLLLLGPRIDYPPHAHEAEEFYLPLAGTALWMRGDAGLVHRGPGQPVHHPSWMPHAMRTEAEPLLALYVWRGGDLGAKSRIVGTALA